MSSTRIAASPLCVEPVAVVPPGAELAAVVDARPGFHRQTTTRAAGSTAEQFLPTAIEPADAATQEAGPVVRKLIAFDDDTFDKLKQLGRDRMATVQELADEAFADMLRKHGIPIDLKDALRKSASITKMPARDHASAPRRKTKS